MLRTLVENNVIVNLTLLVNEMIYFAGDWETVFPEMAGDIPDYVHPRQAAALEPAYAAFAAVPEEQLVRGRAVWPKVLEFARRLYEAKVRMIVGTDGTGGGPVYARELYNHTLAGIPNWEVLRMATTGNADLIGLKNTGRISEGYRADLVFLRANPVEDVRNVREVALVVSEGKAWAPEELLDIAREIAAAARERMDETEN